MNKKLKVGDQAKVIAGSEKNKISVVTAIKGDKVWMENLKLVYKHIKPDAKEDQKKQGRREQKSMPIHISNLKKIPNA